MIFSPLPGTPTITQGFGQNPNIYSQYGWLGHNGIDFDTDIGDIIYAPHDGVAALKNDGNQGYGLYLIINDPKRRSILAHLSQILVSEGQPVYQGDPVAKAGNSGAVIGSSHLHWTYNIMQNGQVQNKDNGYGGAMDVTEYVRLWQDQNLHFDANYTADAQPYLGMTFPPNVYLKNPALHT